MEPIPPSALPNVPLPLMEASTLPMAVADATGVPTPTTPPDTVKAAARILSYCTNAFTVRLVA